MVIVRVYAKFDDGRATHAAAFIGGHSFGVVPAASCSYYPPKDFIVFEYIDDNVATAETKSSVESKNDR